MWFVAGHAGPRVISHRVARFNALNQLAKCGAEWHHVLDVEIFTAGLVHRSFYIHKYGSSVRGQNRRSRVESRYRQIVERRIRLQSLSDYFGRAFVAPVGGNVI